jgi:predicted ATPase/DNA-binding winged helix-turn-helix (wHTH) protein
MRNDLDHAGDAPLLLGEHTLELQAGLLRNPEGRPVRLRPQVWAVLVCLAREHGRVVTKSELLDEVWPGLVVTDSSLARAVCELRNALGERDGKLVKTFPRRGYMLSPAVAMPVSEGDARPRERYEISSEGRHNIPAEVDIMVGRDGDSDALVELLSLHRVVTISGAGGIGKTRLAKAVTWARVGLHRDGVWWVDLGGMSSPDWAPAAVAGTALLQLGESHGPDTLARELIDRNLLLVLDNCEHLADAVAQFVRAVLSAEIGIRILVTSQVPLHVEGEHLYRLDSLAVPSVPQSPDEAMRFGAVALFVAQARAADRRFELTNANVEAIIDLCRRLDGNALAIKLLAARVRHFGLDVLRDRLDVLLALPGMRPRDLPARQHTPHAALDWSYALLSPNEQRLFRILGAFAGDFTLSMACLVAARSIGEGEVLDGMAELIDRSLVSVESRDAARYRMLEMPRAYALQALAANGEKEAVLNWHAQAYATLFEGMADRLFDGTMDREEFIAAQKDASENLRAAIEWSVTDARHARTALSLLANVAPFSDRLHLRVEANRWLIIVSRHLGREGRLGDRALLRFAQLLWTSNMTANRPPEAPAATVADDLTMLADLGDARRKTYAMCILAKEATYRGDTVGARRALEAAARTEQATAGAPWLRAYRLNVEANLMLFGERRDAEEAFARALDELVRIGMGAGNLAFAVRSKMAVNSWAQGRIDEACQRFEELTEIGLREHRDSYEMWLPFGLLGLCQAEQGRLRAACASAIRGLPFLRRAGTLLFCAPALACLAVAAGRIDTAARLLAAGDGYLARTGWSYNFVGRTLTARAQSLVEHASSRRDLEVWTAEGALLDEAGVVQAVTGALGTPRSEP